MCKRDRHVTQWFKHPGDLIVLLGETHEELGASEYLATIHHQECGRPPRLDLEREKLLQRVCLQAAQAGLFSSAHDVAEGGLAVALAEACISHPQPTLGARVTLTGDLRPDALLFGESQSRAVVSVRPPDWERLKALLHTSALPFSVLGEVGGTDLEIVGYMKIATAALRQQWQTALAQQLTNE